MSSGPSFLLVHILITYQHHPSDPHVALKRVDFFPIFLHVCDTSSLPLLPDCGLLPLQPLAGYLTPFPCLIITLLLHCSGQDFTWSDRFLYFQLTFHTQLTHHLDDESSMYLWNFGLFPRDYMALHPRKLSPWSDSQVSNIKWIMSSMCHNYLPN
jgi:hypothetical protein